MTEIPDLTPEQERTLIEEYLQKCRESGDDIIETTEIVRRGRQTFALHGDRAYELLDAERRDSDSVDIFRPAIIDGTAYLIPPQATDPEDGPVEMHAVHVFYSHEPFCTVGWAGIDVRVGWITRDEVLTMPAEKINRRVLGERFNVIRPDEN